MLPLQVFGFKWYAMQLATNIFSSLYVFVSSVTGYIADGILEMRPSQIACNYARTFILLDILIIVSDLVQLIIEVQRSVELYNTLSLVELPKPSACSA